jgi:uncharacterized protein (TIRG00374 family)
LRSLLRPKVVIPTVLGLALIGALLGVSDLGQVVAAIGRLRGGSVLAFFALMLLYEVIRGLQWHVLLRALDVRVPLEAEAFSFLLGEATKTAPIGNYFQNYLLSRVEGEDFGQTSATTTLIVLIEVALSLVVVAIVGIDGWGWLRPLILIGLPAFGVVAWLVHRVYGHAGPPAWLRRRAVARPLLDELGRFRRGVATLIRPGVLAVATALGAAYLLTAGAALYVAALGLGIETFSFAQMLALYLFSLAAGLIVPLPVDLGVVEVSGVGALVASGLSRELAVSLMLVNRLLSVGSALVIATAAMPFLRDELRLALRERSERAASPICDRGQDHARTRGPA